MICVIQLVIVEEVGRQGCCAMCLGTLFPKFRRIILPLSSGLWVSCGLITWRLRR